MITVTNYLYMPSTQGGLVQGIRNNAQPKNAICGGNGSFIVPGNPPAVYLQYNQDGQIISEDMYSFMKRNFDRRVTKSFADNLFNPVIGQTFESKRAMLEAICKNNK